MKSSNSSLKFCCVWPKSSTLVWRGFEELLNEYPIYVVVINSQHMKLWLCSHPHWLQQTTQKLKMDWIEDEVKKEEWIGKRNGLNFERMAFWYVIIYFIFLYEKEMMRMEEEEEELCNEIRPTKIPIQQSKIRPDFIPNLANFPSWYWITGQAMGNYKIKTRNK